MDQKLKLNNGEEMPVIGMGTYEVKDEEKLIKSLEYGYKIGYRLIDTAKIYQNEQFVGKFLSTIDRKDVFLTTKLWNSDHDNVMEACKESLEKLGTDYIDLYLIHWPVFKIGDEIKQFNLEHVWTQMEKLVESKMVKSIGVSNFGIKNLKKLMSFCKIAPTVNQIELHPYHPQKEIREFCEKNNIVITSYSTLGSSDVNFDLKSDKTVVELASKYNVTSYNVLLSYVVKLGMSIIPRSTNEDHIKSNTIIVDLSKDDLEKLDNLGIDKKVINCVSFGESRFD